MRRFSPLMLATATTLLSGCGGANNPDPTRTFDLELCSIPSGLLFFGGVVRDGIPALVDPITEPGGNAQFIDNTARVLGVVVDGQARAYPMAIMWWHEVANDILGDSAVLVTYCPLTGSGIAFDPVIDGRLRDFGVSGLLFENNLMMFDRQNESLWNQMLLGSQCGPDRGRELTRLPIVETTWGMWKRMHPTTDIISPDTLQFDLPYGRYPYGNYADPNNPLTQFPGSAYSNARPPKELVLGVHEGPSAKAYPFGSLAEQGEVVALNDSVGDRLILVMYVDAERTALAFDRRVNGQELTFSVEDPLAFTLVDAETGTIWGPAGEAISGPLAGQGARLSPLADAYVVFWFAWSVYYPHTELFL